MKYVRVYEGDYIEDEYVTTYQEHCEHVANLQDSGFDFEGGIVKQADTIKELCDVFVGVDESGNHYTHTDSVDDLIHMTYDILHITLTTIYGEIWVDDELHKVAILNEKGELELL